MGFLFDLPLIVKGPVLIGVLVGVSLAGLGWLRKRHLPTSASGLRPARSSTSS